MNVADARDLQDGLASALTSLKQSADVAEQLNELLAQGYGQLPLPGAGKTLQRWRALAAVAQHDLSLAKLYEGHTDALAIIAEIDDFQQVNWQGAWGVWASESPGGHTVLRSTTDGDVLVDGIKLWCSGALTASQALLTAWPAN